LRELDAVLNSTTSSLTHKLRTLTAAIQAINPDVGPSDGAAALVPSSSERLSASDQLVAGDTGNSNRRSNVQPASAASRPLARFQLLLEIAEELTRYKIGVEDKVRVSGQACDNVGLSETRRALRP
jgi:hypothetical protein